MPIGPYCTVCGYLIGEGACHCDLHDGGPHCTWCSWNPCKCPGSFEPYRRAKMMSLTDELIKAARKNEEYERTLLNIYENVQRTCGDAFLKHCILSAIRAVVPENRFTNDEPVVE